jgi:hypothetical protein
MVKWKPQRKLGLFFCTQNPPTISGFLLWNANIFFENKIYTGFF